MWGGVTVQASPGWWQEIQARPFVPKLWKKGFVVSTEPVVLTVRTAPVGSGKSCKLGSNPPATATMAMPRHPAVRVGIRSLRKTEGLGQLVMVCLLIPGRAGLQSSDPARLQSLTSSGRGNRQRFTAPAKGSQKDLLRWGAQVPL